MTIRRAEVRKALVDVVGGDSEAHGIKVRAMAPIVAAFAGV